MFFRFSAALILIVLVSMASIALEKRTLELRRAISRQYYQTDLLIELHVRLRLQTQRLTAPAHLITLKPAADADRSRAPRGSHGPGSEKRGSAERTGTSRPRPQFPLLRFQQPFHPEGQE